MRDSSEEQRLQHLMESAWNQERAKGREFNEKQVELAKERTQYFEKIALGSGATIAAVVSFVGSHSNKLRPEALLRSSLVVFAVAMIAAMTRNWLYPYYVSAVLSVDYDKALLGREEARASYFSQVPSHSLEDGLPIDGIAFQKNHRGVKAALDRKIGEFHAESERWLKYIRRLETASLFACGLGIVLLIALAWLNF